MEIEKGSLKLREMCKYIKNSESNCEWKNSLYKEHRDLMIQLLLDNIDRKNTM